VAHRLLLENLVDVNRRQLPHPAQNLSYWRSAHRWLHSRRDILPRRS
jgi:hypothetical protein